MRSFAATSKPDALVIGASLGGLTAAAYLAAAGKRVLVLEEEAAPPEPIGPVYALDPTIVTELRLPARGLRFINRDLALALPGEDGLLLPRNVHAAARALGALSDADAKAWPGFRRELHGLARQLRVWWWSALHDGEPGWVLQRTKAKALFARLSVTGADAWLASHFGSDALIAALLFDASAAGLHVSEPGSALALVWRAAQEMAGLEGAAAMPAPGSLTWSLIKAAGGANFRCCAKVTAILDRAGVAAGVRLSDGEEIEAPMIFSSLPRAATLALAGGPARNIHIGEARVLISLARKIAFPAARLILAERSEIYWDAHEAARAGKLAAELPMELAAADGDAAGTDRIAVTLRPVPALLAPEDRVQLAARAVQALSRQAPGAARLVSGLRFSSSAGRVRLTQLLAPAVARVKLPMSGLYLCGADAEPLPSLSGRAARIAVKLALDQK